MNWGVDRLGCMRDGSVLARLHVEGLISRRGMKFTRKFELIVEWGIDVHVQCIDVFA